MPEQPTTLDDAAAGVDDLQRQVDSLLSRLDAEAPAEGGDGVPAPEPADAPSDARIEALDQQLAALSEELLQQDGDDEPAPASPPSVPAEPPDAPTGRQVAPAQASQTPAPQEQPVESSSAAQPATAAKVPGSGAEVEADAARAEPSRVPLTQSVCAVLAGAVEPVARRVSGLPRGVRDSIGWIGAMTLFYAACVWTVVLVLRGPGIEPPDGPPPEIASESSAQATEPAGEN